ncbi:MAG: hypothetical protein AB7V39_09030, partial [Nitrospiraceae bacterium]
MSSRVCVLFAGNMGHGKDTAANMLADICRVRRISPLRMAFADPIKDIAVHLLGIPKEVSYGTQQDKLDYHVYDKSARHWLQWIGTEMGRQQIHEDIWIHRFADKALQSDAKVVIGSDCRFNNEMSVMRELLRDKMRLYIVRIVNPRVPVNLAHQSESEVHAMDDRVFDHIIHYTSSLSDLVQ